MRKVSLDPMKLSVLAWFAVWLAIVSLRALYTKPPEPAWFVGIAAAGACMFTAGWLFRGGRDDIRRERIARRRQGRGTTNG